MTKLSNVEHGLLLAAAVLFILAVLLGKADQGGHVFDSDANKAIAESGPDSAPIAIGGEGWSSRSGSTSLH